MAGQDRFLVSQMALRLKYFSLEIARWFFWDKKGLIAEEEIPETAKAIETIAQEWYAHFGVEERLPGKPLPKAYRPSRPFPRTYGDWVSLAEDIKDKLPDDPITRSMVNKALQHIADEDEISEESKRWLIEKAGELGIT